MGASRYGLQQNFITKSYNILIDIWHTIVGSPASNQIAPSKWYLETHALMGGGIENYTP